MRLVLVSAAVLCTAALASPAHAYLYNGTDVDVQYWTGTGANQAVLVVDWKAGHSLAFGYRWDGTATGGTLLDAVIAQSDNRFYREYVPGQGTGAIFGIGYDVDGDGFAKADPDDFYAEGWTTNGYWSYWNRTGSNNWAFGSAFRSRPLTDGVWDGWSWAPNFKSSAPVTPTVPEPAAAMLAGTAAATLLTTRRRRSPSSPATGESAAN
jgi:hypothetical protein